MSSSTHPHRFNPKVPDAYHSVPYAYVNGQPVWYVWDQSKKAWVLPK